MAKPLLMLSSNEIEHIGFILTPVFSSLALSKYSTNLLTDFLFLVVPQYLSILCPSVMPLMIIFFVLIICANCLFDKTNKKIESRIVFDIVRFVIIAQTTICILLCDFKFWHKRLGKNDYFGVGLMDLGVAFFIFNGALLSSVVKNQKRFTSSAILVSLGLIRLYAIRIFNLDVNPAEYGTHWNFYFTLFSVQVLFFILNSKYNFILGTLICVSYEIWLMFYYPIIFSEDRHNFLFANKEGLISLVPYLGSYLILNHLGKDVLSKDSKKAQTKCVKIFIVCSILHFVSKLYSEPSRRLSNLGYMSWILAILSFSLAFMHLCSKHLSQCSGKMALVKLCSKGMLDIFLVSNLCILLAKLCFNLEKMSFASGNLLFVLYLILNLLLVPKFGSAINKKSIKDTKVN